VNRARPDYFGPAALLRAFRYIFDSRDSITDARLEKMDNPDGVWGCKTMWWCTEVCPKEIPITKCLGQIKRAVKNKK
jgi:succinate dehydrogenase / fumarate reductase iron-sulfur subunit